MGTHDVVTALEGRGGVARAATLLGPAVSRGDLRAAVRGETVLRLRPGVFGLANAEPAVLCAAAHGGELACVSALRGYGVWILADDRVHVWLGSKGRAHPHDKCRCVDHHSAGRSSFGLVSLVDALVQSARCAGRETFFAAYESAWRLGLLSAADRVSVRSGLSARYRWLVDIARADADSGLESILRLRLAFVGIRLETQVWIESVGRVDFVVAGRLIIEVDGRANHEGGSLRHKDLVRDAHAAALGYETLRFDYAMVLYSWPLVLAAIQRRLGITR